MLVVICESKHGYAPKNRLPESRSARTASTGNRRMKNGGGMMKYDWIMEYVDSGCLTKDDIKEKLNRLADLEDKIEQGTLIELPCKVGDTVYVVYTVSGIDEWEVKGIDIFESDILFRLGHKGTEDYNAAWLIEKGKYLFLTREEAEKRLKELQK